MASEDTMLLTQHKNALCLAFSPRSAAYAEVAAYVLSASATTARQCQCQLRLGLLRDLAAPHSQLIVPAGFFLAGQQPSDKDRVVLTGKSTAARFVSRLLAPQLYASLALDKQAKVDQWLDDVRQATDDAKLNVILAKLEKPQQFALVDPTKSPLNLTLADLAVWDLARQHTSKNKAADQWVAALEKAAPALKDAAAQVDQVLATTHVLDEYRFEITKELARITGLGEDFIFPLVENKYPKDAASGDFSIAVPRMKLPGSPAEIAKDLESKFTASPKISSVKASGVFLKIWIHNHLLRDRLIPRVLNQGEKYGQNSSGFGKVSLVEFSSPNIAKPFHVGHLRSTIIGNFIENTLQANGWTTVTINYLGDWGKQFGLLAVGYLKHGNEEALEKDPIRHLFEVYVKINAEATENPAIHDEARAYFARMEEGGTEALGMWKKFVDLSIVKYREIYGRVNVSFDLYSGESHFRAQDKCVRDVVQKLKDLDLLKLDQGAQVINMEEYKLGVAIIEKRDGGMMYLGRDVAAAVERQKEYKFDNMIYVVGSQQDHHFKQLFKILELMGVPWAEKCQHVNFGMIKSKDGNMSTRKGTVVFLEDILDNVQESMLEVMKRNEAKFAQIQNPTFVADTIGITGIMIQDMGSRRNKDYEFNWDRMLAFEGDTGPYLQYAHTRLCSIERKAGFDIPATVDMAPLTEPVAAALLDCIAMYPDVVREVGVQLEPCSIVSYAFRLSHAVSNCLEELYVMNQPPEIASARLAMYKAARITLGNALRALGIVPLDRM
ncbi:arginyl-tRNA synthetase [Rhizoclosmatium globosum]|uniref:arginine--tRNA ligase n=1 Tax=Rhizoclosmatium globosum TaxID=329046 RepID=A0A1Y2CM82_9FUNG|nr:arginyl-tRNA synthetase [Rhizoclosmatium globosum]|eukprot:ORY48148.1 arginyl-tRNA synthetase [Rhizoclosmatium globosum]